MSRLRVTGETKVERFTIWDNFGRHVLELKAIGATDDDLKPLRLAAEQVSAEEEKVALDSDRNPALEDQTLESLTAPLTCANGWIIQPPTLPAKRWATTAILKVTGGEAPADPVSIMLAITAGLWVLKTWGDGHKDTVMQVLCGSGALAELLPSFIDQGNPADINRLSEDFSRLMGYAKKKVASHLEYETALSLIRSRFQPATPSPA